VSRVGFQGLLNSNLPKLLKAKFQSTKIPFTCLRNLPSKLFAHCAVFNRLSAALEQSLSKPLRYFRVLARFAFCWQPW